MSVMLLRCLGKRMDNIQQLAKKALFWQRHRNCKQMKVDWRFTADDARIKLKKLHLLIDKMYDSQTSFQQRGHASDCCYPLKHDYRF